MSTGVSQAPATALPRLPSFAERTRAALLWSAAAGVAGAMAALGLGPLLLLVLPLLAGALLGLLGNPVLFLWILVATSGVGFSWLDRAALSLGGRTINVSGLHWGSIAIFCAAILVRERLWPTAPPRKEDAAGGSAATLPRPFALYVPLVALAWLGMLWAPDRFEALKQAIQFAAPLLIGVLALVVIHERRQIEAMRRGFWMALALACALAVGSTLTGLYRGIPGLSGALVSRSFAIFLLPLMALALAGWRYRSRALLLVAALLVTLTLLTLSRMALLTMVVLLWAAVGRSTGRARAVAAVVGLAALLLAFQYEPFRARIFADPEVGFTGFEVQISGRGSEATLSLGGVDLTGRGLLWLQTGRSALLAPLTGHGTGSATHYLASVLRLPSDHPHNDYLRLLHDLGIAGFILGAVFVLGSLRWLRRLQAEADGPLARELALAAFLACSAYALMALTDNVMIYVSFFTQNVFLLVALAVRARELETAERAPAPAAGEA